MSRIYRMRGKVYWSAAALLCLSSLPHAVPSIARKSCELHGSPAPEELVAHVQRIAAAMNLPHPDRTRVFITSGFSSVSAGCTALPRGAVIGLPRTVLFRTEADAMLSGPTLEGQPVDWGSEVGQRLVQLLVPSTEQTNFSIAHEVAHLLHWDFLYRPLLAPLTLVLGYHTATFVPKYVFPQRQTAGFVLLFTLTLVVYAQLSSAISHWQEHRADRTAALCRHSYCLGGVESMKKKMMLDSMFRKPPSKFSFEKFVASLSTHPSLDERLKRLEDLLTPSADAK